MREQLIRGAFSTLAGAVFTACSAEWYLWATEQRSYWKLIPSFFLGVMAIYEASKVWKRVDALIEEIT